MIRRLISGAFLVAFGSGVAFADPLSDIFAGAPSEGVVSMESILSAARAEIDGTVTEIELERKRGAWVYEVEVVAKDGRKYELLYDARSGERLSRKRD